MTRLGWFDGLMDPDGLTLLISLLLRSKPIHVFVLIMCKMHRCSFMLYLFNFFYPFGSLFGFICRITWGKTFLAVWFFILGQVCNWLPVLPKCRHADVEPGFSWLTCQREIPVQNTDSILIWFLIVSSFLGSAITFFLFFSFSSLHLWLVLLWFCQQHLAFVLLVGLNMLGNSDRLR